MRYIDDLSSTVDRYIEHANDDPKSLRVDRISRQHRG